jgi:hypothetical protein
MKTLIVFHWLTRHTRIVECVPIFEICNVKQWVGLVPSGIFAHYVANLDLFHCVDTAIGDTSEAV